MMILKYISHRCFNTLFPLLFLGMAMLFTPCLWAAERWQDKDSLKVLHIGNSYTNDVTALLPLVTRASGSDTSRMCLYKLTRPAASFRSWVDMWNDEDSEPCTLTKVMGGMEISVTPGTAEAGDGSLWRRLLTEEQWDLIVIQQRSIFAPYYDQLTGHDRGGYLEELLSLLATYQPFAKVGWTLVHSYWGEYADNEEHSSLRRWEMIAESSRRLCEDYGIDFVIPYGTAVQNLRTTSLNNAYDLTRDGQHCALGLCQYAAACCYYEALIAPRSGISVLGNKARYDVAQDTSGYPSMNVTDENATIAQAAALWAVKNPYGLTALMPVNVFQRDTVYLTATDTIYVTETQIDTVYVNSPMHLDAPQMEITEDGLLVISSSQANAVVYYTLDGTLPDEHSLRYTEPVPIGDAEVVRAVAVLRSDTSEIVPTQLSKVRSPISVRYIYGMNGVRQSTVSNGAYIIVKTLGNGKRIVSKHLK